MKPTRCTLLLSSIFISTFLDVSGSAHHQENLLYLCDTGIFVSEWVAVCSADQTATQTKWKLPCRIDTVSSPDDGHIVARNMREVEINVLRSIVDLVGFIWKRLYRMHGQQNTKYEINTNFTVFLASVWSVLQPCGLVTCNNTFCDKSPLHWPQLFQRMDYMNGLLNVISYR